MATLAERFDAVCMQLGMSNKDATIKAITEFVERIEFENKLNEGCGQEHICVGCGNPFDCWSFCGQTFFHECKLCFHTNVNRWGKRHGKH